MRTFGAGSICFDSVSDASVTSISQHLSRNLDELVERRAKFLAEYQNTGERP